MSVLEFRRLRLRRQRSATEGQQGLVQASDWRRPSVKWGLGGAHALLLVLLVIGGLGPILWLAKAALTPTQDTLSNPMAIFPHGFAWSNISDAWNEVDIGLYIWNTVVIAFGSWLCQIVVATTGAFALSVLRPKWGRVITAALLTTLFVPSVVLLVPLYLEVVHPPVIHHSFVNSYWAIWLPAGASAFNVIIMKRFFDNLPREIFEAARIDGAGPVRLFVSIVLPMSKPILGVVSIFAVLASWKDFLWPLLVLSDPSKQPVSVRLPTIAGQTELGVFLAAMLIACLVPIVGFLIFQRSFLHGTGLSGALKG
jgi:multiple sugar transport system permease protein